MSRPAIVCATNRIEQAKLFAQAWRPIIETHDADAIFMHDDIDMKAAEELANETGFIVLNHETASKTLDVPWIVPQQTSACKSFAIFWAYHNGNDPIYVLDDDCLPAKDTDPLWVHTETLNDTARCWTFEPIVNDIARGTPYLPEKPIALSVGLWLRNGDFDAIESLRRGDKAYSLVDEFVPFGAMFPMSGMNVCFKRDIAPLMYFGLQGPQWGVDRFDDIWCGWIAKRILDHLELATWCGEPYIIHDKASDPFVNIVKEAPGYKMNNDFFMFMRNLDIKGATPIKCMKYVGEQIVYWGKQTAGYWEDYGKAIQCWCEAFLAQAQSKGEKAA